MSWIVASFGKPEAVRKDIAEQFIRGSKCVEPEESIRQAAAAILDKAIANQANVYVVASASGSQGYVDYSSPDKGVYNSLNVQVEVIPGFQRITQSRSLLRFWAGTPNSLAEAGNAEKING